jgi:addiction module RelB/DinJ family antitoxin
MKTATIQTRVPKDMKEKAAKILKRLGLDFSTLNRMVYAKVIEVQGIPFQVTLNKTAIKWDDLTEKEEEDWDTQVAEASLNELWSCPEDDIWDEILPNLPAIDTID